jgi:hypothetical protein
MRKRSNLLVLLAVDLLLAGCLAGSQTIWVTNLTTEPKVVSFYGVANESAAVSLGSRQLKEIPCGGDLRAIVEYEGQTSPYSLYCGRRYVLRTADGRHQTELIEVAP